MSVSSARPWIVLGGLGLSLALYAVGPPAGAVSAAVSTGSPAAADVAMVRVGPEGDSAWPRWRGPSGQGLVDGSGYADRWSGIESARWSVEVPGAGNSSPVLWGQRIFLTTAHDSGSRVELLAFARDDGRRLWSAEAPAAPAERPHPKNGHASGTPATDGERVYAYLGNHGLLATDLEGRVLWHRDFGEIGASHGTAGSPLLYEDRVIVYQDMRQGSAVSSFIAAFDRRTGETVWWTDRAENTGWGTPIAVRVGDRDEIVVSSQFKVYGYDPDSGAELWSAAGNNFEVIPTPVIGHGLVFTSSGRAGPTLAIRPGGRGDVTDSHVVWSSPKGSPFIPSTLVLGDWLFMVNDMASVLTVYEARTGEVQVQRRLGEVARESFSASPVTVDGKVFFTNDQGETFVIDGAPPFEVLGVNRIGERTLASLAAVEGTWYVRTAEHLLAIGAGR